jgi:hypothetical protein
MLDLVALSVLAPRSQLPSAMIFGLSSARKDRTIFRDDECQLLGSGARLSKCARRRITSLKSPPGHPSLDKASTVFGSSQRRAVAASGSDDGSLGWAPSRFGPARHCVRVG